MTENYSLIPTDTLFFRRDPNCCQESESSPRIWNVTKKPFQKKKLWPWRAWLKHEIRRQIILTSWSGLCLSLKTRKFVSICKSEFPNSNHLWTFSIDDLSLTKDSEFQKLIFIRDFYIVNLTLSLVWWEIEFV